MRHSSTIPRRCAGAVRRRDSRPGRIGWKRPGYSSVAKRLRADDDARLAPEPNFKTLTSPAIKLSGSPIGVASKLTFPRDSRGNFADFAVLPDDDWQSALAKFDAFFSGGATMGLGCNAGLR